MVIDLNRYKIQRQIVKKWLITHPTYSLDIHIKRLTEKTSCPMIVICYFLKEILGDKEELLSCISRLKSFYKYEDVIDSGN